MSKKMESNAAMRKRKRKEQLRKIAQKADFEWYMDQIKAMEGTSMRPERRQTEDGMSKQEGKRDSI